MLKLLFKMGFQRGKLILEVPPASPALHVPAWPISWMKARALRLQRELIHLHEEGGVEAQVVFFVLEPWRMHVLAEDVDMHMGH